MNNLMSIIGKVRKKKINYCEKEDVKYWSTLLNYLPLIYFLCWLLKHNS